MLVLHANLHVVECIADIGRIELVDGQRLRIVALDRDDGDAALSIIFIELLDTALIHLSDRTMIAGENHDENTARRIVAQLMGFPVDARKREIGRGRAQGKNGMRGL